MKSRPIDVLLAEDNEDDVALLEEALARAALLRTIRLHVARDGVEALAFLRKEGAYTEAPDAGMVLLDINMPRRNGFEVLDAMKADPNLKAIPVVMLTSSEREVDVVRSYAKGACSYVTKPVQFDEFRRVVRDFSFYWTIVSRLPAPGAPGGET